MDSSLLAYTCNVGTRAASAKSDLRTDYSTENNSLAVSKLDKRACIPRQPNCLNETEVNPIEYRPPNKPFQNLAFWKRSIAGHLLLLPKP